MEQPVPITTSPPPPPSRKKSRYRCPSLDDVEDVHFYRKGGNRPVDIGDVIVRRYRIYHKLGNGGFGMVWLARDWTNHQWVALKILRADDHSQNELRALEHLRATVLSTSVSHLRDTFNIRGPNGIHRCLVTDFVGPSLRCMIHQCWKRKSSPSMIFRKLAGQKLAGSVASLHAAGICHGDLTDANVLLKIRNVHDWKEQEIYDRMGPVKREKVRYIKGEAATVRGPRYVVEPLDYSCLDLTELSSDLLLTDFGEAFSFDKPPKSLGTDPEFAAPEALFGYSPSCAVDLWALGSLIYELSTFEWLLPCVFNTELTVLIAAIDTIGPLPQHWRSRFVDKSFGIERIWGWFDNSLHRKRALDVLIIQRLPDLSLTEKFALINLLNRVIVFEPSRRLSAMEVSGHRWFEETWKDRVFEGAPGTV